MHAECCFDAFIKEFNFYCVTAINKTISGGCALRLLTGLPYCSLMKQIMMIVHFRKKLTQNGSSLEANFGSHILRMVAQFRPPSTSFQLQKLFSTCFDGSTIVVLDSLQR